MTSSSSLQEEFGDEIDPEEQLEFFRQFGCADTEIPMQQQERADEGPWAMKMEA